MTYTLRPYQQAAHDAAIDWISHCLDPCLLEVATGGGKALIVAALAHTIHSMSGKKILCIAPSSELVEQNYEKYRALGVPASIFSASLGKKDMSHNVVFGTPQTVANQVRKFGKQFSCVIVDEAQGVTPTLMKIVDHMRNQNPKLRVVGMTATPYRLGSGYIYANHYRHGGMDEAIDPFFHTLVYDVGGRELIDAGYLTPPVFESTCDHYDTSGLTKNSMGQWSATSVDEAFVGRGLKTSGIIADVVAQSRYRKGVMIFASTVQHAKEIMESLPPGLSRLVTGNTDKKERRETLADFKARRVKYLVNVSVLTTGFDAPHVDVIAILRATESVALLQQITGRGLRLDDDKRDCLILDYAENLERHCPGGDVFDPDVRAKKPTTSEPMSVKCPLCSYSNEFGARKNDDGYGVDEEGYFVDLAGQRIEVAEGQPLPAHYGRRCQGEILTAGTHQQCAHMWSFKECHECSWENDIAARYCRECKAEIIDPNEKLREEAVRMASDPYRLRMAPLVGWFITKHVSAKGIAMVKIRYDIDEHPHHLYDYIAPEHSSHWMRKRAADWCKAVFGEVLPDNQSIIDSFSDANRPSRIAFSKKRGSKFFEVKGIE